MQEKAKKLNTTEPRRLILGVFHETCNPLTVDDISQKLKNEHVHKVTIYRNLSLLEKQSVLKKISLPGIAAQYERAHHHHHHIVCTNCGVLEECLSNMCESGPLKDLFDRALKGSKKFKIINDHSLELFGVCRACRKK